MQLTVARVCLDCEEIHESQQCPVCASETFAYLTRWIPRLEPRAAKPPPRPILTPTWKQRIVFGGGAISLLAYGLFRWKRGAKPHADVVAFRKTGEPR
jgi:hypothetical protein